MYQGNKRAADEGVKFEQATKSLNYEVKMGSLKIYEEKTKWWA